MAPLLDPTISGVSYKLVISGSSEAVNNGTGSVTWFVSAGGAGPFDELVEQVVDAIRGFDGISGVACTELNPTADGTVRFAP